MAAVAAVSGAMLTRKQACADGDALGALFDPNQIRVAPDRSRLFDRGESATHVFLLIEGAVELSHRTRDGSSTVVKILVGPCFVGVAEAVGNEREYLADARVAGTATWIGVDKETFLCAIRADERLALHCLADIGASHCQSARFEMARLCPTQQRLACLLLGYVAVLGEPGEHGMRLSSRRSQAELAAAIGASERSVNRTFTTWKRAGLLRKSNGLHTITDMDQLEELAGDLHDSLVHRGNSGLRQAVSRARQSSFRCKTRRTLASN